MNRIRELSALEASVMTGLTSGRTTLQVAAALQLSEFAVEALLQSVCKKLNAVTPIHAAVKFALAGSGPAGM